MTTQTLSAPARPRDNYGRLWAGVPRELAFLLPTLPIVVTALSVLASVFFTGTGMIFIVVGIFIVVASLFIARGFGMLEILRLRRFIRDGLLEAILHVVETLTGAALRRVDEGPVALVDVGCQKIRTLRIRTRHEHGWNVRHVCSESRSDELADRILRRNQDLAAHVAALLRG